VNTKSKAILSKIWPFSTLLTELDKVSCELENEQIINSKLAIQLETKTEQYNDVLTSLRDQEASYAEKRKMLFNELSFIRSELESKIVEIENLQIENCNIKKNIDQLNNQLAIKLINSSYTNSAEFWEKHYENNGNSGTGSYNALAQFKADFINHWLNIHSVESVIEFGCGDGNQLSLINYKNYTGIDVAPIVIERNKEKFKEDRSKKFYDRYPKYNYMTRKYQLSLSLDVIFHLLEDSLFEEYMKDLFESSEQYVIIYSSNHEEYTRWPEYRHRKFMKYIQDNIIGFSLIGFVPNKYPHIIGEEETTTESDFYIFEKVDENPNSNTFEYFGY